MNITFWGTCSGTAPVLGFRHMSFTVEHNAAVYWFDAGENCSYAACTNGIDLLKTRSIFISHTHMDHIGGLPNLLWNIRKLNSLSHAFKGKTVDVFMPRPEVLTCIMSLLSRTKGEFKIDFTIKENIYGDGVIFAENGLKVSALHNFHVAPANGKWMSYSFLIEADGKSVVYSGDIKSIEEILPLIDNVDLLLVETGHHMAEDICKYLAACGKNFDRLLFVHHGSAILNDFDGELRKAKNILGNKVSIATDGMTCKL